MTALHCLLVIEKNHHLFAGGSSSSSRSPSSLWRTGAESILEATRDVAEVLAAASAGSLSPLGLLGPLDCKPFMSEPSLL